MAHWHNFGFQHRKKPDKNTAKKANLHKMRLEFIREIASLRIMHRVDAEVVEDHLEPPQSPEVAVADFLDLDLA